MWARIAERLHGRLHQLPGMPMHSAAVHMNQSPRRRSPDRYEHARPSLVGRHPALRNLSAHHAKPPRVLPAWQEWIRGLFIGRGDG
jgi:hypothetical protein